MYPFTPFYLYREGTTVTRKTRKIDPPAPTVPVTLEEATQVAENDVNKARQTTSHLRTRFFVLLEGSLGTLTLEITAAQYLKALPGLEICGLFPAKQGRKYYLLSMFMGMTKETICKQVTEDALADLEEKNSATLVKNSD